MITIWYADQILTSSGDATAIGTTVSYTYSFIAGTATGSGGAVNGTASGVTVSEVYSLIAGSATASSQAAGVIAPYNYALISGAASSSSQVPGQTLSYSYSLLPGTATGGSSSVDATANGVTVGYSHSFSPGAATGKQQTDQPQFIGDGVYRGHERAAQERIESRDRLREIVARSYDKVVGAKATVALPQEAVRATKSQRRNIATRAFTEIKTEGLLDTLENIGDLITKYEATKRQQLRTYDDDLMIVMMLA